MFDEMAIPVPAAPVIKLCKDCEFHSNETPTRCWWFAMKQELSPVDGVTPMNSVDVTVMRMTMCGWKTPKLWEPKP